MTILKKTQTLPVDCFIPPLRIVRTCLPACMAAVSSGLTARGQTERLSLRMLERGAQCPLHLLPNYQLPHLYSSNPATAKKILPNLLQQPRSNPFDSHASQHLTPRPQRRRTPFAELSHPDQRTPRSQLRRRDNGSRSNLLVQTKHDGLDE